MTEIVQKHTCDDNGSITVFLVSAGLLPRNSICVRKHSIYNNIIYDIFL